MADEYLKVIIKLTPNVSKGQTGTAETCVLGERSGAVSKGTREGHGQLLRHLYGRVVTGRQLEGAAGGDNAQQKDPWRSEGDTWTAVCMEQDRKL